MNKEFPTLYKRAKSGDVQFWRIETHSVTGTIIKTSGRLGTENPIMHREEVKGKNIGKKNETTPVQQAELQAESDWKKKHDEGYKTLKDLGIDTTVGAWYSWNGQSKEYLSEILQLAMPKFNSDASGNVKPMLAITKAWAPSAKNKYPRYAEPKLDGVRATIIVDGTNVTILSRSGKPYDTLGHIASAVKRGIGKGAFLYSGGTVVLDGEIYLHGLLLEEINEAVKKPNVNTPGLQFWMYDVASMTEATQQERTAAMLKYAADINEPDYICFTVHYEVNSDDDVQKLHDQWLEKGFEGAMLKDPEGVYQQGQRSSYWTKVKMFDDSEFAFKNFELGQREEDLIAVCWVETDEHAEPGQGTGTQEFRAKMKGSRELKAKLYARNDLEGMSLTVKHFGYSKYGVPNLPSGKAFRLLKDL